MRLAYCPNCRKPTSWVKRPPVRGQSILASGAGLLAAFFQKTCCQNCSMSWSQLMDRPFSESKPQTRSAPH